MIPFARILALGALLALVLTSAAVPTPTHARASRSRQPASAAGSCCSPSQVAKVEARLPIRPVNPAAALLRPLGEHLRMGGTIPGGRAPGSLTPKQALALCGTKSGQPSIYPHLVAVSGYLRVQRWKPSDPRIYGVLFGNGSVPLGTEYHARWMKYGGLSLGIPARLFHHYLSLPNPHSPVAWHGTLRCSGTFSRLHVEWLDLPFPSAGR